MVWKFGPKPCEQLLFLLRSKLNALIWQEFRNPNKSADPTKLQHVSHCEEVNGLFCCHRPAHTFKAKCASKLPKGNYSQSSLSLMLIPHFWNNILLSSWGVGPHADVTIPHLSSAQGVPRAIWLQTRIKGYTQDRAVTADKEALDGVDLTSKGFFALFWFFFLHMEGLIFIWTFGWTLNALSGLCMNAEFWRTSSVPWNWKNSVACWERWLR